MVGKTHIFFPALTICWTKFKESLDGRVLVPYQCVVLRSEWVVLRSVFSEAFGIQKGAYRRAHGGKTAPSLQDSRTGSHQGCFGGDDFLGDDFGLLGSVKLFWAFMVCMFGLVKYDFLILPVGRWSAILKERQM